MIDELSVKIAHPQLAFLKCLACKSIDYSIRRKALLLYKKLQRLDVLLRNLDDVKKEYFVMFAK